MADKRRIYYCHEIESIKCCSSCHWEWEDGYGDAFDWEVGKKSTIETCCGNAEISDDRKVAAKYLLEARKHRKPTPQKPVSDTI